VPLTFPAHQAAVLPLKLWRPRAFDATALCAGAAAPDLAYPLGSWLGHQSHTALGIAVWAVPCTLVVCGLLRWRVASGLFAHLPDLGPFRVRSYRVLVRRRPLLAVTVLCALLGSASHVVIDGFTHNGRWGAEWLGLDQWVVADLPVRGELTAARGLQYLGHVGGSLIGLALFAQIGRRRLLERWYGAAAVAAERRVVVSPAQRAVFWAVALVPPVVVAGWVVAHGGEMIFGPLTAAVAGLLVAGGLPLYRDGDGVGDGDRDGVRRHRAPAAQPRTATASP
jgi:hypothetical protein